MTEKSETFRERAREHNEAFDKTYESGDSIGAAFEAMDAIAADRKAEELNRFEHPEVERLDRISKSIAALADVVNVVVWCLVVIVILLTVITYKLW